MTSEALGAKARPFIEKAANDRLEATESRLREAERLLGEVSSGWFGNGFDPEAFDRIRAFLRSASERPEHNPDFLFHDDVRPEPQP